MSSTRILAAALAGAASVAAHGFASNIVINGVSYAGYDTTSFPYQEDPPVVVGWATSATDLGFVAPDAYGTADIICHRDGTNAGGHAQVTAGDSIFIQWNTWPESHHGPVLDYLASCGTTGCETVDKTTLEFFKIDEVGLVDGTAAPGQYGDDLLMANGLGWLVEIPASIKPGFYVLRHEIIALHSAGTENGAQNYPQCFNLEVTGSGTEVPAGVLGTELYSSTDEGILFNIYTALEDYPVPGPAVIAGASAVEQATSAIKTSASATTGTEQAAPATDAPETTAAATSAVDATTAVPTTEAAVTSEVAVTTADATTEIAAPTSVVAPTSTTAVSEPEPTTAPPGTCKAKRSKGKKSKKARRHARDVQEKNVAPIRK